MSVLEFLEPVSPAEACGLLAADPLGRKAISGGTALVLMMRQGLIAPDSLVSLSRIPDLHGIEEIDGAIRIGASTTLAQVATSPIVRAIAPSAAYACSVVGNPRIRNTATLGGNLAEADYASDPPATLSSLGARCHVIGPAGQRAVPVADLITGFYETVLEQSELISHVDVPVLPGRAATYLKYRTRSSEDRACVGVAARADFDDQGRLAALDLVVAAVASTLQRVPGALEVAIGRRLDADLADEVAHAYSDGINPMDDARGSAWYRSRMIEVFVRRALLRLAEAGTTRAGVRHG